VQEKQATMQIMEQILMKRCEVFERSGDHLSCVKLATRLLESHPHSLTLEEHLTRSAAALSFSLEVREVIEQSYEYLCSSALLVPPILLRLCDSAAFRGRLLH